MEPINRFGIILMGIKLYFFCQFQVIGALTVSAVIPFLFLPETVNREIPESIEDMSRCQFHQHFTRGYFIRKFFALLFSSYSLALYFLA